MKKIISASMTVAMVTAAAFSCDVNEHWVGPLAYYDATSGDQPCSYAGTLPSNAEASHHMFYWMYPNADTDAPIAIWLNGGPGASSTFANFLMNGPLRIERTGETDEDFRMYLNAAGSWVDEATMIFIDQPVGTGFSWGEGLLTNMDEAADEFIYFLEQLFTMYPNFVGKDLYFTGESYGGKYLPRYSYAMLMANQSKGSTYFNLKATLCGDPYTAPMTQRTHMHIVPEALNILDDSNMPQIAAMERRCQEILTDSNYSDDEKGDTCAAIMDYIVSVSGDAYPYDQRIFGYDWSPIEQPTIDYFTISGQVETIFETIHVADSTKRPVFEMGSSAVGLAFAGDQLIDYSSYLQSLIEMGSPFLVYAGEFDAQDGPKTQEFWLRRMPFTGSEAFWSQSRQIYWVDQPGSTEQIVGGYWRESEYFSYLTVPKAGHFVPNNYYIPSLSFFTDYINNQKLVCHNPDGCGVIQERCELMNSCSGHGSCDQVTGQCACDAGWKSADCSMESKVLVDGYRAGRVHEGPKYHSFTKEGSARATLSLFSDLKMDVYVSKGSTSDPTQFSYDIAFKQQDFVRLDTDALRVLGGDDGFSVTTYSQAYDEGANTYLYDYLRVEYDEIITENNEAVEIQNEAVERPVVDFVESVVDEVIDLAKEVRESDRPIKHLIDQFLRN